MNGALCMSVALELLANMYAIYVCRAYIYIIDRILLLNYYCIYMRLLQVQVTRSIFVTNCRHYVDIISILERIIRRVPSRGLY